MNFEERGFSSIILFTLVVGIFIVGGGWYFLSKKTTPIDTSPIIGIQTQPQTVSVPPITAPSPTEASPKVKDEIANWKVYRNEKYGFEFKYPTDHAVEFLPTGGDEIARFHVHDPHFDVNDKVGAEIRTDYSEVIFKIYPYTEETFAQKTKIYRLGIKEWDNELPQETIIKSLSGDIKVYELHSGLVGPYLQGHFHNNKYIFEVYAIFHEELAENILSTFKFFQ